MKKEPDVAAIRRDIDAYCSECTTITQHLRYWISGIGAAFVLLLGALVGNSSVIQHISNSAKLLVMVGVIVLAANMLVLVAAIVAQETSHHGMKFIAVGQSRIDDGEVMYRFRTSRRAGNVATFIVFVAMFLSFCFLTICIFGVGRILWS